MVQPWVSDCDIYRKIPWCLGLCLVRFLSLYLDNQYFIIVGICFFSPLLTFMATSSIFIVITIFFLFELCISHRNGKMFTCITLLFQLRKEKLNASWHLAKIHKDKDEKNRQLGCMVELLSPSSDRKSHNNDVGSILLNMAW